MNTGHHADDGPAGHGGDNGRADNGGTGYGRVGNGYGGLGGDLGRADPSVGGVLGGDAGRDAPGVRDGVDGDSGYGRMDNGRDGYGGLGGDFGRVGRSDPGALGGGAGPDVPGVRDGGGAALRLLRLFEGHRLTPVQRRIAHCLAQHAAEAPFLSSIEVAELAGVSQPSVTRFAMALGYDGYPALRRRFRELDVGPGRGETGPDGGTPGRPAAPPLPGSADGWTEAGTDGRTEAGADMRIGAGTDGHVAATRQGRTQTPAPAEPSRALPRPGSPAHPLPPGDPGPDRAPGPGGPGGEYRRAVLAEIENLRALARSLDDPEPVIAAARLLAASRPLPVLGLRAAAAQAAGFAYFAAKVHPDVRPLHEAGSLLADRIEQAAAAGATALLCFALPRYPAELVDALRAARTAGLSVVTVADRRVPALAGQSDVLLTAAVGTHLVFDTACAPMMLGRVLLDAMCDELPGTQARLEAFETSAAARGVFLID